MTIKVLFVCMGNICRSPTAEGVFKSLLTEQRLHDKIMTESAGTHSYHIGEPPDLRSQDAARRRNIDLSQKRARQVRHTDFVEFDYILAMDRENDSILKSLCPPDQQHKLQLFLNFAPELKVEEVPDPYFGGSQGFEQVLDLAEAACQGLLNEIRQRLAKG